MVRPNLMVKPIKCDAIELELFVDLCKMFDFLQPLPEGLMPQKAWPPMRRPKSLSAPMISQIKPRALVAAMPFVLFVVFYLISLKLAETSPPSIY